MTKRAPSLSCRLARSRRTLAAFLLLGGAAMSGMASPAAAHDHAAPTIDVIQGMAESLPKRPDVTATPLATWSFDNWLAENYGLRPASETVQGSSSATASVPQPGAEVDALAAAGEVARGEGDAVEQLLNSTWIQNWLPWGTAASQWVSPLLPAARQDSAIGSPVPAVPLAHDRSLARALSELTCVEPVDVDHAPRVVTSSDLDSEHRADVATVDVAAADALLASEPQLLAEPTELSAVSEPPATAPPRFGQLALVGSSPIIMTLPDSYLSYDLSPEDAIAMRMYPIDQPAPYYSAARRTSVYGAVATLNDSTWRITSEPAVTVSTAERAGSAVAKIAPPAGPSVAEQRLAELANQIVQAAQPDSELRNQLRPEQLGRLLGQWGQRTSVMADGLLAGLTRRPAEKSEPNHQIAQAELQAPRQLPGRAAPMLPTDEGRVLQVELACQAALEVVLAQSVRSAPSETAPALAEPSSDPITSALAVATACDHAAASLEKLAMAIRRAGDSWVRQAQANAGNGSLLR